MKTGNKKIGWQKYEDVIESQIRSPLSSLLFASIKMSNEEADQEENFDIEDDNQENGVIISIPESLSSEIQLTTNFDCWVGHTNFNITEQLKEKINRIEGVEVLKIYSRYRFFIGVGKMFEFKDVRKDIESQLTGNTDEKKL